MKKQKLFTFSKYFAKSYSENYVPGRYLTIKDEFADSLLKQGYLIKNVTEEKTITIRCIAARANIPLNERRKMQEEVISTGDGTIKILK